MNSFILENEILRAEFIEYGARLKSLVYKPADTDVCVGCDSGEDYLLELPVAHVVQVDVNLYGFDLFNIRAMREIHELSRQSSAKTPKNRI